MVHAAAEDVGLVNLTNPTSHGRHGYNIKKKFHVHFLNKGGAGAGGAGGVVGLVRVRFSVQTQLTQWPREPWPQHRSTYPSPSAGPQCNLT